MKAMRIQKLDDIWPTYRSNCARHLLGVARYLQTDTMATLVTVKGHTALRLSFEPFISLVDGQGASLTRIAEALGISKQAANQTANQIEKAGYIHRVASGKDKRSKILQLTPKGKSLLSDGIAVYQQTESRITAAAPDCDIPALSALLAQLIEQLELPATTPDQLQFGALLSRLSDYINARLMAETTTFGHKGLKLSFAHILSQIGPAGTRMQDIARIRKISKQAVSAIAQELVELGYIERVSENGNNRQQRLKFTAQGIQLINDSVAAVGSIKQEFESVLGKRKLARLEQDFQKLYQSLDLEREEFGESRPTDIPVLAEQLISQLGEARAVELAHYLLSH